MTIRNPRTCVLPRSMAIALTLACMASSVGGAERKVEKPAERPRPEKTEPATSPLAVTDAELRRSFKEYTGLRLGDEKSVYLTFSKGADLEAAANLAREAWIKTSGKEQNLPNFAFVEAAATLEELKEARVKLRDVLTIKGVVYLDLDESCGCLSIGAGTKEVISRIVDYIKELNIDTSWVTIVQTPEYRLTADLTEKFRPTMGGQQIRTIGNSCTLGLPVYSWLMHTDGILTASHCTQGPQGDNWATPILQGPGSQDFIADESLDLGLFDNTLHPDCPSRRFCRYSDAVFANYAGDLGIRGRVSRPSTVCTVPGVMCDLMVDRPTDDIRIAQATIGFFTGQVLDKVGMRSGWTRGAITNTCVDVNVVEVDASGTVNQTDNTMLCQTLVATSSFPGDSGAPVFQFYDGYDAGNFAGILWGATVNFQSMVFSPIDGIQKDLGNFAYNQEGVTAGFWSDGQFYTSNLDDQLYVTVERNVKPADEIEVVLVANQNISARKEIVLVEGAAIGTGRWTIATSGNTRRDQNGLYTYQLPGGHLEFRRRIGSADEEVSRLPIGHLAGGTRLTFTWQAD